MVNKFTAYFHNRTKLWIIGILLLLIIIMFFILPTVEDVFHISQDMVSIDEPDIHTPQEIHNILNDWGEQGRIQQVWFHSTWDIILPILYFFFIGFLISWFTKRGFKSESAFRKMSLVSLIAVVDILENIALFILIFSFPSKYGFMGWIKTGLTLTKYFIFGPAIVIALIIAVVFAIRNRFVVQE